MVTRKNLNLYITEDMLMKCLLCFTHQTILENLQISLILNTEMLTSAAIKKSNNILQFKDILTSVSENDVKTFVYQKPTFNWVYANINKFIFGQYKIGQVFTLLSLTFSIVSNLSRVHTKVSHL